MKNFRKTIIALATVAAMLVPSVAMAATITAEVDKSVAGNVYAGYYTEEGVLVKAEKGEAITAETGSTSTLPCTVTITDEVSTEFTRADGAEIHKLVLTAKAEGKAFSFGVMLSYDNTKIVPLVPNDEMIDIDLDEEMLAVAYDPETKAYPFSVGNFSYESVNKLTGKVTVKSGALSAVGGKTTTIGNRTGVGVDISTGTNADNALLKDGLVVTSFYYRVLDGQKVDADTFKIERDLSAGSILDAIGEETKENGLLFTGDDHVYNYGSWRNSVALEDTITLVWNTPWVAKTKTITINDATAPAAYKYIKVFVWDDKQVAQCAPADGTYNN